MRKFLGRNSAETPWLLIVTTAAFAWFASNFLISNSEYRGKFLDDERRISGELLEAATELVMALPAARQGAAPAGDGVVPTKELDDKYRKFISIYWGKFAYFGRKKVGKCVRLLKDDFEGLVSGRISFGDAAELRNSLLGAILATSELMKDRYERNQTLRLVPFLDLDPGGDPCP